MGTASKKYSFRYEEVSMEGLGTIGHDPAIQRDFPGETPLGLRITVLDAASEKELAEGAEGVYFQESNRLGISWGGDPTFADVPGDIEEAIDCFLNRGDAWENRN